MTLLTRARQPNNCKKMPPVQTKCSFIRTKLFFLFLDCLLSRLSSLRKGAIICWFWIFQSYFSKEKAIYNYVSLPAPGYDFISETVLSRNLTKINRQKCRLSQMSNLLASKLLPVGHHHLVGDSIGIYVWAACRRGWKRWFYYDSDRMIRIQSVSWSRCCVLG